MSVSDFASFFLGVFRFYRCSFRKNYNVSEFYNFRKQIGDRIQNEQTKKKDFWYFWSQKYGTRSSGFPPTREGQKHQILRASQGLNYMGKLEPLNLAIRACNPLYYDKSRDMETALAYNAIKKVLESKGREELFGYIKSIKLTDKNIVITTGKPVVNTELKMYRESILESVNICLKGIGGSLREKIIVK